MVIKFKNKLIDYSNESIVKDKSYRRFLRNKRIEFGDGEKGQFSDVEEDDDYDLKSRVQTNQTFDNVAIEPFQNLLSISPLDFEMLESPQIDIDLMLIDFDYNNSSIQLEYETSSPQTVDLLNQSAHESSFKFVSLSNAFNSNEIELISTTHSDMDVQQDIERIVIEPNMVIDVLDSIGFSNENNQPLNSKVSEPLNVRNSINDISSRFKKRGRKLGTRTNTSLSSRKFGSISVSVESNQYSDNRRKSSDAVRKHRKVNPNSKMVTCLFCNGNFLERGLKKHTNKNPYCRILQQKNGSKS